MKRVLNVRTIMAHWLLSAFSRSQETSGLGDVIDPAYFDTCRSTLLAYFPIHEHRQLRCPIAKRPTKGEWV